MSSRAPRSILNQEVSVMAAEQAIVNPRRARELAGVSQLRAAADAGVSLPTLRMFEANPDAIQHEEKRAALIRVYAAFRARAA